MRQSPVLVAAGVVGAVAAGAVAVASIPNADGVIHTCYNGDTGALRVVDPPTTRGCSNAETALSFNQKGPAGPQGPPGPAGPAGPEGSTRSRINPPAEGTKGFGAPTRALGATAKRRLQQKYAPAASNGKSAALSTWRDAAIAVPDEKDIDPFNASQVTVAALDVPAGRYVAVAKATMLKRADVTRCRLQAGADFDTSLHVGDTAWEGMTLTVVHDFAAPGRIELRCYQTGAHAAFQNMPKNSSLRHTKITAMQFDELSNKAF